MENKEVTVTVGDLMAWAKDRGHTEQALRDTIAILENEVSQLKAKGQEVGSSREKLKYLSQSFDANSRGDKIQAIKNIRFAFAISLKDAKDIVEGCFQ